MANAIVGDDVMKEDKTVQELEAKVASCLGFEAALFTPSGTMANSVALGVHCPRGGEIILGSESHIFCYEGGGASRLHGLAMHCVPNDAEGKLRLRHVRAALRGNDDHLPRTAMIVLENTQNRCNGAILEPAYMRKVREFADFEAGGLPIHVDGARIWNAAAGTGYTEEELLTGAQSAAVCLSKGLGAPLGSLVAGSREFVAEARRLRKTLGGGMRQVGVVAAAGLYAFDHNRELLAQDRVNMRTFATGLGRLEGIRLPEAAPQTNILYFDVDVHALGGAAPFIEGMAERGVLLGQYGTERVRAVTHLQVSPAQVEHAVEAAAAVVEQLAGQQEAQRKARPTHV